MNDLEVELTQQDLIKATRYLGEIAYYHTVVTATIAANGCNKDESMQVVLTDLVRACPQPPWDEIGERRYEKS